MERNRAVWGLDPNDKVEESNARNPKNGAFILVP
jgi:hypothetical protein